MNILQETDFYFLNFLEFICDECRFVFRTIEKRKVRTAVRTGQTDCLCRSEAEAGRKQISLL